MASTSIGPHTSGTLTQLIATGAMNSYLCGTEMTLFRSRYLKITSFAAEAVSQPFNTVTSFGSTAQISLNRTGDLISSMYMSIDLCGIALRECKRPSQMQFGQPCQPCKDSDEAVYKQFSDDPVEGKKMWRKKNFGAEGLGCNDEAELEQVAYCHWSNAIGFLIIKQADFIIGGQVIDSLWSDFLWLWEEVSGKAGRLQLESIGKRYSRQQLICESAQRRQLFVSLPYFFSQSCGSALSLSSLSFHGVSLHVNFEELNKLIVVNVPKKDSKKHYEVINADTGNPITANDLKAELMTTYIYLDQQERTKFVENSYEQLIVTHQRCVQSGTSKEIRVPLHFNHCTLELLWCCKRQCSIDANAHFNYSGPNGTDPFKSCALMLNNQGRFSGPAQYFRTVQPFQHHTRVPESYVYVYSFAIAPESWEQPSGQINLSRLDSVEMAFEMTDGMQLDNYQISVFARSYNILRFRDGLAGCAFAN